METAVSDQLDFDDINDDPPPRRRKQDSTAARAIVTVVWLVAIVVTLYALASSVDALIKLNRVHDYLTANPSQHAEVRNAIGQDNYNVVRGGKDAILISIVSVFAIELILFAGLAMLLTFVTKRLMSDGGRR